MTRLGRAAAAGAAALLLATGCTSAGADDGGTNATLTVFAAASLQEPFEDLGEEFEDRHDGVEVRFHFAGSSTLVQQIRQGAPADVLASADPATMDTLVEADLNAAEPVVFTSNTLMIAVPPDNPAGVEELSDLGAEGLELVVCAPAVPCGAAARAVEEAAGLSLDPVSEEQSVTDVLGKVTTGQADAGLVYATDVRRAGDTAEGIAFPEAQDPTAVNTYPIAPVSGARQPELGEQFVDLVTGETGRQVLTAHGFGPA